MDQIHEQFIECNRANNAIKNVTTNHKSSSETAEDGTEIANSSKWISNGDFSQNSQIQNKILEDNKNTGERSLQLQLGLVVQ